MLFRYLVGVVFGSIITAMLFFMMQALIQTGDTSLSEPPEGRVVDFVRLEEEQELEVKDRKPEPPPPPDEPPPDMPEPSFDDAAGAQGVEIGAVDVNVDVNVAGTGGFSSDGEYLPIVKVAPEYPRRAQERGIEGFVLLEFTVTESGSVEDPKVVEADPPGVFDRAAKRAAVKFKYKPKVVDGEAVRVQGVQNRIIFEMADGGRRR